MTQQGGGSDDIEKRWLQAGSNATALLSAALEHSEAGDDDDFAFVRSCAGLFGGMDQVETGFACAWLAKLAMAALMEVSDGSVVAVRASIQQMALDLVQMELETADDLN